MEKDYELTTVDDEALFDLLPHIVRATDPGAIRTLFAAMAQERNVFIEKSRLLPRLQDPDKAAKFDIAELGEDPTLYAELQVLRRQTSLTELEQERKEFIESLLPKTLEAEGFEQTILRLLAKTVGSQASGQYQIATMRELVATAILRHRIKGTHTSVFALGRILGFVDVKLTELWSRFAIKDPSDPRASKNNSDFSPFPEEYPYWPQKKSEYDGNVTKSILRKTKDEFYTLDETFQLPAPSPDYNPKVIDDASDNYVLVFPQTTYLEDSVRHYNRVVDGKNPFGNFQEIIQGRLIPGQYVLAGGDSRLRAFCSIPIFESTDTAIFEASTIGDWANGIKLDIATDTTGNQTITMCGPQSKIKYKTSLFDTVMTMDSEIFPSLFAPIAVETNDSASALDLTHTQTELNITNVCQSSFGPFYPCVKVSGTPPTKDSLVLIEDAGSLNGEWFVHAVENTNEIVLRDGPNLYTNDWTSGGTVTYGRLAGDYPWTGSDDGTQVLADPETLFQMSDEVYNEIVSSLRVMVENTRPLSRDIRRESLGYMLQDGVNYAPVLFLEQAVLISDGGVVYESEIDDNLELHWVASVETPTTVVQRDWKTNLFYQWTISDTGEFSLATYSATLSGVPIEPLVFLHTGDNRSYFHIDNGELVSSLSSPEQNVASIHGDGTDDESVIGVNYPLVVENPLEDLHQYYNDEATSDDVPADNFIFQNSPEDEIEVKMMIESGIATSRGLPVDSTATNSSGVGYYNLEQNFNGFESRNRFCGIQDHIITPPPSGTESGEDGIRSGYPIQFINKHNVVAWRDRLTNEAKHSYFLREPDGENTRIGGARIDQSLSTHDGPNETGVPDVQGVGVTQNDRVFDDVEALHTPWKKHHSDSVEGHELVVSLEDDGGYISWIVDGDDQTQVGARVLLEKESDSTERWATITTRTVEGEDLRLTTDLVVGDLGNSIIWYFTGELQVWRDGDIQCEVAPDIGRSQAQTNNYRVIVTEADGTTPTSVEQAVIGPAGLTTTVSVNYSQIVHLAINGQDKVAVTLTHVDDDIGTIEDYDGDAMWRGAQRDDIAVSLTDNAEVQWWDGGAWS